MVFRISDVDKIDHKNIHNYSRDYRKHSSTLLKDLPICVHTGSVVRGSRKIDEDREMGGLYCCPTYLENDDEWNIVHKKTQFARKSEIDFN